MRIEAQGKYLQSVLEKAEKTLGKQNFGTAVFEAAEVQQLSDLVSKASEECINPFTGLEEIPDLHNLQRHAAQFADCSIDSCLTTCEGSPMDREMHGTNMILRAYHGNLSLGTAQMEKNSRFEQIQSAWCGELNGHRIFPQSMVKDPGHGVLPVERDSGISSISITKQKETAEGSNITKASHGGRQEQDAYLEQPGNTRAPIQQKSPKKFNDNGLPCARRQLDLNVQDANNHACPDYKEFDLYLNVVKKFCKDS